MIPYKAPGRSGFDTRCFELFAIPLAKILFGENEENE
jgi:hypothetical protein